MYVEAKAAQIRFFSSSTVFIYITFRTHWHKDFVKFNSTSKGRPVENTGGFAKKNEISAIHYTEESHHIVRNSSCVSIMLALQPVKQ